MDAQPFLAGLAQERPSQLLEALAVECSHAVRHVSSRIARGQHSETAQEIEPAHSAAAGGAAMVPGCLLEDIETGLKPGATGGLPEQAGALPQAPVKWRHGSDRLRIPCAFLD